LGERLEGGVQHGIGLCETYGELEMPQHFSK